MITIIRNMTSLPPSISWKPNIRPKKTILIIWLFSNGICHYSIKTSQTTKEVSCFHDFNPYIMSNILTNSAHQIIVFQLQDKASYRVYETTRKLRIEYMSNPVYSPILSLTDYLIFPSLTVGHQRLRNPIVFFFHFIVVE